MRSVECMRDKFEMLVTNSRCCCRQQIQAQLRQKWDSLIRLTKEMSLKYIEYRNLLFRWGFPSFQSRFPSELTWFWQNFAFQSYLCAKCHLIHRKFHHFNQRNLVSNFSNSYFDSIFNVMTIFEIFSNSIGGQTCFKLNHKVGLCHGRLTALNLRMRVSWLWWYNSRGRY